MDEFLGLKLNQEDINHLNIFITSNKSEAGIKNLPRKKNPGPNGFTASFSVSWNGLRKL
jgi:hypothetical protein